jgi:hypothetical protein
MITWYESKINKYIAIFDYIYIICLRLGYIVTFKVLACLFFVNMVKAN